LKKKFINNIARIAAEDDETMVNKSRKRMLRQKKYTWLCACIFLLTENFNVGRLLYLEYGIWNRIGSTFLSNQLNYLPGTLACGSGSSYSLPPASATSKRSQTKRFVSSNQDSTVGEVNRSAVEVAGSSLTINS
jgi:hypothetical protein